MFRVLLKDAGVPSNGTKGLPQRTDIVSVVGHVRKVPILLQKSKVDQPHKSRES